MLALVPEVGGGAFGVPLRGDDLEVLIEFLLAAEGLGDGAGLGDRGRVCLLAVRRGSERVADPIAHGCCLEAMVQVLARDPVEPLQSLPVGAKGGGPVNEQIALVAPEQEGARRQASSKREWLRV